MLTGKIIDKFEVEGKGVKIRYPEMKDLDDILKCINSIIDEGEYVLLQEKQDREEEVEWLVNVLKKNEKNEKVHLVVEVNGKVLGGASVEKQRGAESHIGKFGIALAKEIREMGIGTKLAEAVFEEAGERLDVEILKLDVFEENERARNFYKKLGFEEVGEIEDGAVVEGEYQNTPIMQKKL